MATVGTTKNPKVIFTFLLFGFLLPSSFKEREGRGQDPERGRGLGIGQDRGHQGGARTLGLEDRLGNPRLSRRPGTGTKTRMRRKRRRSLRNLQIQVRALDFLPPSHLMKLGTHPFSLLLHYFCLLLWGLSSVQFLL